MVLRFGKRPIHAKPSRMWELRRSLQELIEQRFASGMVLQKSNGHLGFAFALCRCMFAVLKSSYVFADRGDGIAELDERTLGELRVAAGLLPFLVHRAGQRICDSAYCSDPSSNGFALQTSAVRENELDDVVAVRERWRFRSLVRRSGESHRCALAFQPAESLNCVAIWPTGCDYKAKERPVRRNKAFQAAGAMQQLLLDTKLGDNAVEHAAVE